MTLEERIVERMSTSEQITDLVEAKVRARWETAASGRSLEDRVKRLENTVRDLQRAVRKKLVNCSGNGSPRSPSSPTLPLAGKGRSRSPSPKPSLTTAIAKSLPTTAAQQLNMKPGVSISSHQRIQAVHTDHAADNSQSPHRRLPSMNAGVAAALFIFGPVVQSVLWTVVLLACAPSFQSSVAGFATLDGSFSVWLPVGWWHVSQLTGQMHSLATLSAGPAPPSSLRFGNMIRSLTMYLPGAVYFAAKANVSGTVLFAFLTAFGSSDCTLHHPFVLELLKAVMPGAGELDSGMRWRAGWVRQHRECTGDVVEARLFRAAAGCLALVVSYVSVANCTLRHKCDSMEEDRCLGLGLANLLIGVSVTWLCCFSTKGTMFSTRSISASLEVFCWSIGFAPASLVAFALLLKDSGDGEALYSEVMYVLFAWIAGVVMATALAYVVMSLCRKLNPDAEEMWKCAFEFPPAAAQDCSEAVLSRERWWFQSWPVVGGPWGAVCVSPRRHLPLFVVEYPSSVAVVDLRCSRAFANAQAECCGERLESKPSGASGAFVDIDWAMLREVVKCYHWTFSERLHVAALGVDWHAILIWALNLAESQRSGDDSTSDRNASKRTCLASTDISSFITRPALVCQVPFQHPRSWVFSRCGAPENFALKLSPKRPVSSCRALDVNSNTISMDASDASTVRELDSDSFPAPEEDQDVEDVRTTFHVSECDLLHGPDDATDAGVDTNTEVPSSPIFRCLRAAADCHPLSAQGMEGPAVADNSTAGLEINDVASTQLAEDPGRQYRATLPSAFSL